MRNVKWLSAAILVISIAVFAGYNWKLIKNKDNLGPVITLDTDLIEVSVTDGEETLLQGVTATDAKDGDVTDSVVIESISDFVEGNIRYVNYAAFDSDDHVSKTFRKAVYTDYTPIRFSLDGPLRFPTSNSVQDILSGVHAADCLDGDISDRIIFSRGSSIIVNDPSNYKVQLQVTNSAGDTQNLPVTVTIYDRGDENTAPQINLTEYLVYTKVGNVLDPLNYLESVNYKNVEYGMTAERGTFLVDTSEMSAADRKAFQEESETNPTVSYERFNIRDNTDYQTPGVYEIQYTLEDSDSHRGRVNLVVVVEE